MPIVIVALWAGLLEFLRMPGREGKFLRPPYINRWFALLCGCSLLGQTAAPPGQPLILRSTTRLVQVSVVVHDRKGQPVADLHKEDFTVTERGKPQTVAFFAVENSKPATGKVPEKMGAGWYSNQLSQRAGAPNAVTVLLIDALNTQLSDQISAREQAIKFLETLQPQDRVGIYHLGTNLRILHDFTSDSASLVAKMRRFRGESTPENTLGPDPSENPTGDPDLDAFLSQSFQVESDFHTVNRVVTTCAALEAIAHHLETVPGRKNLLWLSSSFPLQIGMNDLNASESPTRDRRTFTEETERAVRAVNQANLAIYPVDARGLKLTSQMSAASSGASVRNAGVPNFTPTVPDQDTLIMLADRTGGRAFYNTNDLAMALRKALRDAEVTYVLGYYPAEANLDGRFREIKVKVSRGGLDVRYRHGYFALPETPRTEKQIEGLIRDALWSPLEATGIGLRGGILALKDRPGEIGIAVQLDAKNVWLEQQKDQWMGKLTLVFVAVDKDLKTVGSRQQTISLHLTKQQYEETLKNGLSMLANLPKQAAIDQMRIAVLDVNSGNVGSLRIPVR